MGFFFAVVFRFCLETGFFDFVFFDGDGFIVFFLLLDIALFLLVSVFFFLLGGFFFVSVVFTLRCFRVLAFEEDFPVDFVREVIPRFVFELLVFFLVRASGRRFFLELATFFDFEVTAAGFFFFFAATTALLPFFLLATARIFFFDDDTAAAFFL